MFNQIAYNEKEMRIIHAIFTIDPKAVISVKGNLDSKHDYKYGGVIFLNRDPIPWEQIIDKIQDNSGI